MKKITILFRMMAAVFALSSAVAECKIEAQERIGFLGDSITNYGKFYPAGYVNLVMKALEVNQLKCSMIPAGIGGNKSNDMLSRVEKDVLRHRVNRMLLSCGVNDVWHGERGVALPEYKKNIRDLLEKALNAKVVVDIMSATMITENPDDAKNLKLAEYNAFLKELAAEKNCLFIDVNSAMQSEIAALKVKYPQMTGNFLTVDGVHMNALGNRMMAKTILQSWGFTEAMLTESEKAWDEMIWPTGGFGLSVKEYRQLSAKAFAQNMDVPSYIKFKLLGFKHVHD